MSVSRIAIFRALYLGDMLCIIPTVRAIRSAFPKAKICLVGLSWQEDFVNRFSNYFDEFINFPGWPGLPEQEVDPEKIVTFLQDIRRQQFDLVFQMQGNGDITNTLCMLWSARTVCGLRRSGGYAPDPKLFPISEDGEHEVLRFLKLLACLDIADNGTYLEFPIAPAERKRAEEILLSAGLRQNEYICIHPGARDQRRRWSVDNFVRVAEEVIQNGYSVVLTGSGEEQNLLHELQSRIDGPVFNIVASNGHLNAGELAGILSQARCLVSNDTGVSHIAAALHVPSVIIFSPFSDIERWRPLDKEKHITIPWQQAGDVDAVISSVALLLTEVPDQQQASG